MKKIAVYGSLRKGLHNYRLLEDSNLVSTEVVNIPWRMVSLGGFPGLVPSEGENHDITIEVFEVDNTTYQRVEYLESYPSFYQKAKIETSQGEVEVYVLLSPRYADLERVESGDWMEFVKKQQYETTS